MLLQGAISLLEERIDGIGPVVGPPPEVFDPNAPRPHGPVPSSNLVTGPSHPSAGTAPQFIESRQAAGTSTTPAGVILREDGSPLMAEDGSYLLSESGTEAGDIARFEGQVGLPPRAVIIRTVLRNQNEAHLTAISLLAAIELKIETLRVQTQKSIHFLN
jgi:hypothetical protein